MAKHISLTETAKLIRKALKEAFPAMAFRVRSKSYSGGASISVYWTDGVTETEVKTVTNKFEGASFDGMIDLKSYKEGELNGEKVHFGADYVFTRRTLSARFLRDAVIEVAFKYGLNIEDCPKVIPEKVTSKFTISASIEDSEFRPYVSCPYPFDQIVYQTAREMRANQ